MSIYIKKCMLSKPAPEGRTDTLLCINSPNVGSWYPIQKICIKTLRPMGPQKPSNWHVCFLIVGRIYQIPIYTLVYIYNTICIWFEEPLSAELLLWYWIWVTEYTFCYKFIYLYCIYAANIWGIHVSWRFSVCPSGGNVHFVMNIFVLHTGWPKKKCNIRILTSNLFLKSDFTFPHVFWNQNFEPVSSSHFDITHCES